MRYDRPPKLSPQTTLSSPADPGFRNSAQTRPLNPDFDVQQRYPPVYQAPLPSEEDHFLSSSAINRLLGRDVDLYIEEGAEKYERLAAKWRECTMEEWTAGAAGLFPYPRQPAIHGIRLSELTTKYTRILDLVSLSFHLRHHTDCSSVGQISYAVRTNIFASLS